MIVKYTAEKWHGLSEDAHKAVFGKIKPADWDRISYALLVVQNDDPVGYVTVRENDAESVYWQFGGVFEPYRRCTAAVAAYRELLDYQAGLAKRVTTYIENSNVPMLKLAMAHGFRVIGTRSYEGSVFLELLKEFTNGDAPRLREHVEREADHGNSVTGLQANAIRRFGDGRSVALRKENDPKAHV